nr:hypothetical protein [Tanacetum cinerariifolium]
VGIEADTLFAAKLQQEEREEYTIEERAKFLAETIAAQRRFRAAQRSAEIRSRPPTKSQLRNLMMTYLKNIVPDEKGEVDYEVLDKRFPIINWESKFYHLDRHGAECIYYRIFGSDRSSRWIKTYSKMVTRFDRMDLEDLYNLVMQRFETTSLEGIDLVLWGDLRTMFEETTDDDLWKNQEEWILKSWNFYANCEVHTLTFKDGTEIYMLVERRYPLTKETLKRMLALRLIAESETILSGADNRPPMLEKDMYDSWKSRMELYMMNRQHGRMILESVENGPLIWPSIKENRVTRLLASLF